MHRKTRPVLLTLAFIAAPRLVAERVPGRYIVELSTESVTEHLAAVPQGQGMRSAAAVAHRGRVRDEQRQIRQSLEQQQAQVLESMDTVANALIVNVPDNAAAQLAGLPGVKRVVPVHTVHLLLDRAIVLHRVVDAWNVIGADKAGAGIKIAIIDTGIDTGHPGFQDSSMIVPDSTFPRVTNLGDTTFTNGKVIVARSYVSLLPSRDPDVSARDRVGHGTALAMVSAGVENAAPLASITGVAPRAWLGNYKVFGTPGFNDSSTDDAILKAMDDAVADGMDVLNLSFGSDEAPRLSDDLEVQAIERAVQAGVIVVVAAGNNGPMRNTISSPATAPSAIAVGAHSNDRTFATASVDVPGLGSFIGISGDGPPPSTPVSGPIADVAALDNTGQACAALASGALSGKIALILRGNCTFESKLLNVQRAGAVAGLVYAAADSPGAVPMATGSASIPAMMVSNPDGVAIKQAVARQTLTGTFHFSLTPVSVKPYRLTDFSAAGPGVDLAIKPDLVAVGDDIYVATQSFDSQGDMYDPSGYILVGGTSFSTPLVAGAAALIKAARPGLTAAQYRSLLVNTAGQAFTTDGQAPSVQQAGAGFLDALAAVQSTATAVPSSLSFGAGGDLQASKTLTLTNTAQGSDVFTISVTPSTKGSAPTVSAGSVKLKGGESVDLTVAWNASGLAPGPYEGFIAVTAASTGARIRVPYWYAVSSNDPAQIALLNTTDSARRGRTITDAFQFRVTDLSGLNLTNLQPQVTVISGGGTVIGVNSEDSDTPGMFGVDVQLGPTAGDNVFRITAGSVSVDVTITGR